MSAGDIPIQGTLAPNGSFPIVRDGAVVLKQLTSVQRLALVLSPTDAGYEVFDTDTLSIQVWTGTGWQPSGWLPNTVVIQAPIVDLGAAINAADAQLGASPGTIVVAPGNYNVATAVVLSPSRRLTLGDGTYTSTVMNSPTWMFQSDTVVEGSGWGTVLQETTADIITGYALTVMWAYATFLDTAAAGPTNVIIRDLCIQGANPSWTGSSASSTLMVGNGVGVHIERVFLDRTRTIGINVGGSSLNGSYAQDVWITGCKFFNVASQNIGGVNFRGLSIQHNTFLAGGQIGGPGASYIDFEPNLFTDHIEDFNVSDNLIDARGSANAGNGIIVQDASARPNIGPGTIANNTIVGGPGDDFSTGIYIVGIHEVNVVGNTIRRAGSTGINLDIAYRCSVSANLIAECGGGGNPAVAIGGNHNTVKGNTVLMGPPEDGSQDAGIFEQANGDYNIFKGNTLDWYYEGLVAPPPELGGIVTLQGAHSTASDNVCAGRVVNQSAHFSPIDTVNASRTITIRDELLLVDTTAADVTLTLSDATEVSGTAPTVGRGFIIRRVAGANNVILSPVNAQTIEGAASLTISDDGAHVVQSDGSNWRSLDAAGGFAGITWDPVTKVLTLPANSRIDGDSIQLTGGTNTVGVGATAGHALGISAQNVSPEGGDKDLALGGAGDRRWNGLWNGGRLSAAYSAQAGATYTVDVEDCFVVLSNAAARAVTLYAANAVLPGTIVFFKDAAGTAATGNITITAAGADTIDNAAALVISTNYGRTALISDGVSAWAQVL